MNLYIRISETDICFARYEANNPSTFDFSAYHVKPQVSLTINLRTAMQQVELLKQPTERVEIFVNSPVTPVPLAEFQEEDAEAFHDFCFIKKDKNRVFYDSVPASNTVFLFSLLETTCRAIEESFGEVRYTAALTPVVQHFAKKGLALTNDKRIFVYTHDGVIDVIVLEDSRLIMQNTYVVRALTDVDYYVLNTARNLALDLQRTPIFVAGVPPMRNPVIEELQKYAPRVYPINPLAEFNRNVVSSTEGVPYDLMCALLD